MNTCLELAARARTVTVIALSRSSHACNRALQYNVALGCQRCTCYLPWKFALPALPLVDLMLTLLLLLWSPYEGQYGAHRLLLHGPDSPYTCLIAHLGKKKSKHCRPPKYISGWAP